MLQCRVLGGCRPSSQTLGDIMLKKLLTTMALLGALGAAPAMADNTALIIWDQADPLGASVGTGTGTARPGR